MLVITVLAVSLARLTNNHQEDYMLRGGAKHGHQPVNQSVNQWLVDQHLSMLSSPGLTKICYNV